MLYQIGHRKMAKKFKEHHERDKPKKRGPRKHKKSLNKDEKRQKRTKRYKGQGKGQTKIVNKGIKKNG